VKAVIAIVREAREEPEGEELVGKAISKLAPVGYLRAGLDRRLEACHLCCSWLYKSGG
jgi:hypothetical protein